MRHEKTTGSRADQGGVEAKEGQFTLTCLAEVELHEAEVLAISLQRIEMIVWVAKERRKVFVCVG